MTTKVSFRLAPESVAGAANGVLVGEFNNWNPEEGIFLEKQEDGSLAAELVLTAGKTYEYRYLLSDGRWVNDNNEKKPAGNFGHENCVIAVPESIHVAETIRKSSRKNDTAKSGKAAPQLDDMTKIEGITSQVEALLRKESINTYKDLGKVTIKKLQFILDSAGNKFSAYKPVTWPKQARLAATGKWSDLESWQESLRSSK